MEIKINIECDNAAFEDNGLKYEINNIFADITARIEMGFTDGVCLDTNGNNVGIWEISNWV